MKETIKKAVLKKFGKVETFCEEFQYSYTGFGTRLVNFEKSVVRLNRFLKPLGLVLKLEEV